MAGNIEKSIHETTIPTNYEAGELLKRAFQDNEGALKTIRALLFGYDLTKEEVGSINSLFKQHTGLQEEVRKKIYLELSKDAPIGANPDFWIGTETEILGQHPDTVRQILESKEKTFGMLKKGCALLENPDGPKVSIKYGSEEVLNDNMGINLISRNLYIQAIEKGLQFIKIIAAMDLKKAKKEMAKDGTQ